MPPIQLRIPKLELNRIPYFSTPTIQEKIRERGDDFTADDIEYFALQKELEKRMLTEKVCVGA